jgi:hypothetical protein
MSVATLNPQTAAEILKTHGLQRIAEQLCTEKGLKTMEDIGRLTDADIDALEWLKSVQRSKLKDLCEACRQGDPDRMKSIADDRLRERLDPFGFHHVRMEAKLAELKRLA